MVVAGVLLAIAAREFLDNTTLLWLSTGLSLGAIVLAVVALVLRGGGEVTPPLVRRRSRCWRSSPRRAPATASRLQIDTATPTPSVLPGNDGPGLRVKPVHTGEATSTGAMKRPVRRAHAGVDVGRFASPGPTPPQIDEVEDQVEVGARPRVPGSGGGRARDADEIADDLTAAFDDTYPKAFYDRRTVAWQTIGVIPTTSRSVMRCWRSRPVRWWGSTTRSTASSSTWATTATSISPSATRWRMS